MNLAAGTRFGPYEIIAPLGAGGMGEVYRARDTRLARELAIKILPAPFAADADRLRRFKQEARTASGLNHPNVLTIYDVGEANGLVFIASELVVGETLRVRLARSPLTIAETEAIAAQIAAGLAAAHDSGIVHRDLKPENVMIRPDGLVKILDFGLAKLAAPLDLDAATMAGTATATSVIAGTVRYMSPEQARGLAVDARSDVFSFGVLLYEMIAGRVPHDGATATDVLAAILEREPVPIARYRGETPAQLQQVVARCLEKARERRYGLAREIASALSAAAPTSRAAETASIAVLPFVNVSADPDNEYFCDGLAEELIDRITKIERLRVAARGSAFAFRHARADLREIARALNVSTVLDGSVRKAGSRIRVTAQLINAADGFHLWSDRYDRELDDIFAIQDEIARSIANALQVKLVVTPSGGAPKPVENVDAYHLYLKGRFCRNKWTVQGFRDAIARFSEAIERAPDYALAHAGLAEVYGLMGLMGWLDPDDAWPKAREAAQRALALDESLAPAHSVLGGARWMCDRDWTGAERAFQQAIQRNATYPVSYEWYGFFLLCLRRNDEGLRMLRTMRDLDPLSAMYNSLYGCGFWYAHRYDEAVAQLKVALDLDPDQVWAHFMLGASYGQLGRHEEAIAELEKACAMGAPLEAWLGHAYASAGRIEDARRILAVLAARAACTYVSAYEFALVHVGLGEYETTLDWLERAVDDRNVQTLHCAKAMPQFEPLRATPRFQAFVRRLGLDPS